MKRIQTFVIAFVLVSFAFVAVMWTFSLCRKDKVVTWKASKKHQVVSTKIPNFDTTTYYKTIKIYTPASAICLDTVSKKSVLLEAKVTAPIENTVIIKQQKVDTVYKTIYQTQEVPSVDKEETPGFDYQSLITWILGSINSLVIIILSIKKLFFNDKKKPTNDLEKKLLDELAKKQQGSDNLN